MLTEAVKIVKSGKWFVTVLTLSVFGTVAFAEAPMDRVTSDIVAKMVQREETELKNMQHYRMTRTYELKTADGTKDTQFLAVLDYDIATGKSIQVTQERGTDGLFRHALRRVLETEVRTSRQEGRNDTKLAPENYNFRLLGTEMRDGHKCYVLQLLPKRKTKYLLEGKIWIDTDGYGLVGLEGRPAASLSFWVGRPLITQSFEKVGDFWLLARNRSIVDARLIGRISLTIDTSDVEIGGEKIAIANRRHPAAPTATSVD